MPGDITGSISPVKEALPTSDAELRAYADSWGKRYDADPGEKNASINYAKALRALTQYPQAAAVMQAAAVKAPQDMEILAAYGKALADAGQLQQAADVLSRSYHGGAAGLVEHVRAGLGRRSTRRSYAGAAILSRRAEDRAGRAQCC